MPQVQIPPLGPPGTLGAVRLQGFSAFLEASFPLCFPLPAGNALYELLHPGGAGLLHLVGDVAVDIQGKGGGGVAHVALDGLDVIAAPDGGHSVGVPQIVEPGIGPADGRDHLLVVLIDRVGHQVPAQFVGEHQPGVLPGGAGPQTPLRLDRLLMAEQFHHGGGGGEFAALSALGGRQVIPPAPRAHFLQLLADQHRPGGEVHTFPRQPQHLALAQAGEQGHQKDRLVGVTPDRRDKLADGRLIQRFQFLALHSGQGAGIGGVEAEIADGNRLLERLVEYPVDIFHCLGREAGLLSALGRLSGQTVVKSLDRVRVQRLQPDAAQLRADMVFDLTAVCVHGAGLDRVEIVLLPNIQPLAQRHFARLLIGAAIQFHRDLPELLSDLLLRPAGDRFLLLPAGPRIKPHRVPGFPIGVFSASAPDGLLSDRSRTGGIFLALFAVRHFLTSFRRTAGIMSILPAVRRFFKGLFVNDHRLSRRRNRCTSSLGMRICFPTRMPRILPERTNSYAVFLPMPRIGISSSTRRVRGRSSKER